MYFHFINFRDACNTPCIASRGNFATLTNYLRKTIVAYVIIWWHVKNVTNDVIMSNKSSYRDLFSYISLLKDLCNSHNQLYIFLFFVVPKNSVFPKISGFHMFLKKRYFFVYHIKRNPALDISFFLTT